MFRKTILVNLILLLFNTFHLSSQDLLEQCKKEVFLLRDKIAAIKEHSEVKNELEKLEALDVSLLIFSRSFSSKSLSEDVISCKIDFLKLIKEKLSKRIVLMLLNYVRKHNIMAVETFCKYNDDFFNQILISKVDVQKKFEILKFIIVNYNKLEDIFAEKNLLHMLIDEFELNNLSQDIFSFVIKALSNLPEKIKIDLFEAKHPFIDRTILERISDLFKEDIDEEESNNLECFLQSIMQIYPFETPDQKDKN